jgi:hypothetical protein
MSSIKFLLVVKTTHISTANVIGLCISHNQVEDD